MRDYARHFHSSIRDVGKQRLTDFLVEYVEAMQEAEKQAESQRKKMEMLNRKARINRR